MAEYKREEERQQRRLRKDEMREIDIEDIKQTVDVDNVLCDLCMFVGAKLASYICYMCNVFICSDCYKKHKHQEWVILRSEGSERKRNAELFLRRMRRERMGWIEMEGEAIQLYGRIPVKHELEKKDIWITGLCGLENKTWVALDCNNSCMKIFSTITNALLRYVRFGSRPWDATEIKQSSTNLDSGSDSKSGVSGADQGELDKRCLIAVSFQEIKQIWFIEISKTQAIKTQTINMKKWCESIDSYGDKIITLCEEDVKSGFRFSVDILSAEGILLKEIRLDFPGYISDLSVFEDKIYLSDSQNHKVLCINMDDGKTICERLIEGSGLTGISTDLSNNVYICSQGHDKIYKLSPNLSRFEAISLDSAYTRSPEKICLTAGKLYVSHYPSSSLRNYVTVVQIT